MGVELYITRAAFWAENEGDEITSAEWLAYVTLDPELRHQPSIGKYHAIWLGQSKYDEPWLDWAEGNIKTKWPETALYRKMLRIAVDLRAEVQDDDGTYYRTESEWEFDPTAARKR